MVRILILLFLFFCSIAHSAELKIPFSCWPKELQAEFARAGRKLDIRSENRTEDSWGFLINKGSEYVIYTYWAATPEDFEIIKEVVFKIELEKRRKQKK